MAPRMGLARASTGPSTRSRSGVPEIPSGPSAWTPSCHLRRRRTTPAPHFHFLVGRHPAQHLGRWPRANSVRPYTRWTRRRSPLHLPRLQSHREYRGTLHQGCEDKNNVDGEGKVITALVGYSATCLDRRSHIPRSVFLTRTKRRAPSYPPLASKSSTCYHHRQSTHPRALGLPERHEHGDTLLLQGGDDVRV